MRPSINSVDSLTHWLNNLRASVTPARLLLDNRSGWKALVRLEERLAMGRRSSIKSILVAKRNSPTSIIEIVIGRHGFSN